MDTKKYLLIFSILFLSKFSNGDRFIVNVIEYEFGDLSGGVVKCAGTVISDRNVLTTAACAIAPPGREIGVEVDNIIESGSTSFRLSATVRIHPDLNSFREYNVAVLEVSGGTFNSPEFGPLALGGLQGNQSCFIYGWGGGSAQPRREQLLINSPSSCPGNETQVYCSRLNLQQTIAICSGLIPGSPVLCGDEREVNGIVLNGGCSFFQPYLYYHSVEDFSSWIRWETAGAEMTTKVSSILMTAALFIGLKNFI